MNPHIFVASSSEYFGLHGEKLLQNILSLPDIPEGHVHFVVGGCPEEASVTVDRGVTIDRVEYRCFEFTPMIFVARNPSRYAFEYGFFTHDTVSLGEQFYSHLARVAADMRRQGAKTARIESPEPSMNIGVYHHSKIVENSEYLEGLCMHSNDSGLLWEKKLELVRHEDRLLNQGPLYREAAESPRVTPIHKDGKTAYLKTFERWHLKKVQQNRGFISSISPF